ncbi:tetratricopeptide repeat protein [Limnohabitans sp. Rim8]|uniref:YfgM family protein n=1 Tax=Limnohabitans sp. Rim8 TaxID=1100718 RepID=UPI0026259D55|nr:tetratricopeptide repeat protein [Limnohabitans sp. Rim8]
MAKALDLEEQEQLDQIKHFWKKYGNLISWVLIAVLGAYASWNGYQYWQRDQAAKAAVLFDEVERSANAGDLARVQRSLADIKDKYSGTLFAHQASLVAAKFLSTQGKSAEAQAALKWVVGAAPEPAYRDIARLRLAALLLDDGSMDEAMSQLTQPFVPSLMGLASDFKGDVLSAKNQKPEALSAYKKAWDELSEIPDYRRLVEAKLNALGVDPQALASSGKTQ